ncbi:MAG: protease inhibitor I42 family protein [Nitrospira sp.]|nr:protease inhibitor I42 family protein [Nitrospira sp.]
MNVGRVTVSKSDPNSTTDSRDRRVLAATVDLPFVIHLWEDRTRGEQWIPSYDSKELALLSDEFLRIAGNNAVENGQRIFEFKAITPGTHRLIFEKRMGWKFTAEDRRVFYVEAACVPGS